MLVAVRAGGLGSGAATRWLRAGWADCALSELASKSTSALERSSHSRTLRGGLAGGGKWLLGAAMGLRPSGSAIQPKRRVPTPVMRQRASDLRRRSLSLEMSQRNRERPTYPKHT